MAVTLAISGWPLAMIAQALAVGDQSVAPDSAITVLLARA